ncbi:NUDIX hydrolase [Mycetocola reblochoni]|uniref:MutT3 n=2 Tax=Mycetocola reblochoni TaxID=331618 RepID=A0A1R4J0Z1_9MICO|nr:NUDIX hydrolase [Mycetocola reblochoni]RLP68792.1 NUDIX hydrolase [Mycetocola reblochoni]SJN25323.1 mutT3 [Mycetocola reblochoni REB411]
MSRPPANPTPHHGGDGDGWVTSPDGQTKRWGRYGASGTLAHDPDRGVLLQHRVEWSHFGGTWGIPGGARNSDETALTGALREAAEEAGLPAGHVRPRGEHLLDLGWWSYTTVLADVVRPFEPVVADAESLELAWVPLADVTTLPLHPGFAASWPQLTPHLGQRARLIVDVANVLGATGNGWWRDRAGASSRLLQRIAALSLTGVTAELAPAPLTRYWPETVTVLEGQARSAIDPSRPDRGDGEWLSAPLRVVRAERDGDQAIVDEVGRGGGAGTVVVTADRELRDRVGALGARTVGPRALLDQRPA